MTNNQTTRAYIVAIASGALLWLATAAVTGNKEAWDDSSRESRRGDGNGR